MASSLIDIAANALSAAQAGLDITSQNIANASTAGYVRQSLTQTELAAAQNSGITGQMAMSGVLVTGISRDVDGFLQQQVWRTGAAAAAADKGVTNLTNVEHAVENSNVYSAITKFASGLEALAANPTNPSLRSSVLSDAQALAQSFNLASSSLANAAQGMQTGATGDVSSVNQIAQSLAQLNQQIATDPNPATNGAALLDQRDQLLQSLSKLTDFTPTIAANGTVNVTLGGSGGVSLVNGGTAATLASNQASDGTLSFTLGGTAVSLAGGSLAADQQGLSAVASATTKLDGIASSLITAVNTQQAAGADLNGDAGAAMFSGTTAGTMTVAMTSGNQIAAAAAGSAANSADTTNLTALQNTLASSGVASNTNALLLNLSSAVATATTSQTTLDTIASQNQTQLDSQVGVNLNTEAANLLKYQQAFQASSKVIQTASTLFNQLLQI